MINKIHFKFGTNEDTPPLSLDLSPITVFVGPNNSGKSQALNEIKQVCSSGTYAQHNVIIDKIEFSSTLLDDVEDRVAKIKLKLNKNEVLNDGYVLIGKSGNRLQVPFDSLKLAISEPNNYLQWYCSWYLSYNTLLLDGKSRIALTNEQNAGDLLQDPHTSLQVLFSDDEKRKEVRSIIYDAFGQYFAIDPTHLGRLRIRLSKNPPDSSVEQGLHKIARSFHEQAYLIDGLSDGVKAFTGMITEIIAGDPFVVLIDEPEAFLHPALSFSLGKEIARTSLKSNKKVFVSTHSPNFVMGCINSGCPVNIVRLTYKDQAATARVLPCDEILRLMRNPLLRSTGVISALFYENVIVTEGDADRAFYQEVNNRLWDFKPENSIPNCLFLNAQNKQTIETIVRPLRALGIPAAAIVDVDIIKDGGKNWSNFLSAANIQHMERDAWANLRTSLMERIKKLPPDNDFKKNGGIDALDQESQESAKTLIDNLARYGLFVIKNGELESWLKYLGVGKHGPSWLIEIFEKMGDDPSLETYIKPTVGDVWDFMGQIKTWLLDPQRKGIPK